MTTIVIYDSGQVYQLTVDPDNIPEWLSQGLSQGARIQFEEAK